MSIVLLSIYFTLVVFMAYRRPTLAVAGLLVILPLYGVRFSILGIPGTLLEVSIWAVTLGWFVREWQLYGPPPLPFTKTLDKANPFAPYLLPILLWEVAALVSVMVSPNLTAALGVWKAYFVDPLLVFVLVVVTFRHSADQLLVLAALGVSAAAISVVAWYQKLTGTFLPEPWAHTLPLRVTSVYSYPNAVGLYVGPILAMEITWLLQRFKKQTHNLVEMFWYLFAALLGAGAIIFSVTRGAWVGVAVSVLVALLFTFRARCKYIIGTVAVFIFLSALVPAVRERILPYATLQSTSGKVRLIVWQETLAMLRDHPLTGAGLAGYQTTLAPCHQPWHKEASPYALEVFLYPHNIFLNFWSELGLGGLLVFMWLVVVFVRLIWQRRERTLSVVALAGMTALIVHGLVDVPYFKNDLAVLFWVIIALPLLEPTPTLPVTETI